MLLINQIKKLANFCPPMLLVQFDRQCRTAPVHHGVEKQLFLCPSHR